MMKAYWKDIWRTILGERKRFLSIVVIVMLGVTMMCGLRASCEDLRVSADQFFDEQKLFDIKVLSTLGLTDEDIEELMKMDQVTAAEGGYNETVYTQVDDVRKSIDLRTLSKEELNMPYLQEGRMPESESEIVVARGYWLETGKGIGDVILLEEEPESFKCQEYTITGIVIDSLDINSSEGSMGFRSTATTDYIGYVIPEAADSDIYTVAYLALDGTGQMNCYTDGYTEAVDEVVREIETKIKGQREIIRYDEVYGEAMEEWQEGRDEADEEFAKADKEIADAKQEIADAKIELEDGLKELQDGWKELQDGEKELKNQEAKAEEEFAKAWKKIKDGKEELASGEKELKEAYGQLQTGQKQLDDAKDELVSQEKLAGEEFAKAYETIAASEAQLNVGYEQYEAGLAQWQEGWEQYEAGMEQWQTGYEQWETGAAEYEAGLIQWQEGWEQYEAGLAEYEAGVVQYETMKPQLEEQIAGIELALQSPELTEEERAAYEANLTELRTALTSGEVELQQAKIQLDAASQQLDESKMQLDAAKQQVDAGKSQLDASKAELDAAKFQLDAVKAELDAAKAELDAGTTQLETGKEELKVQEEQTKAQIAAGWTAIKENQAELDKGMEQYQSGKAEINKGQAELASGEQELILQEKNAEAQFAEAWKELSEGKQKLLEGEEELRNGEKELADGEAELADAIEEYEKEKVKAEKELADGLEEINDIDMTKWYVQDRTSLSGYNNVKSDADSIQAIGDIFPVLFLVVAILISLTTITRMVEEERGLIGTYKALGFTDAEIRRKYLVYSALACLIGGVLGFFAGYVVLPSILFIVFKIMYLLPEYSLNLDYVYGLGGILFFEVGVVGASLFSCRRSLRKTPAVLMRPKTPKAGTRVLMERITFIWKRLSFLNKVTARNLFRYKKRLFMTVFGIAGCTGLLLCAFTIKDTVAEMLPQQYEVVYKYDLMAVVDAEDMDELKELLAKEKEVEEYLSVGMEMADLYNADGKKESVQLIVLPEGESIEEYIYLKIEAGDKVELGEDDVLVTRNATRTLDLAIGDRIKIQNLDLEEVETQVTGIVENYFGNSIYMTEHTYKELFGCFDENAVYAKFTDTYEGDVEYTEALKREEIILSANCTKAMKDEFASAFRLLNMVVVVILVMAAALAFAVLFTLSNTNISERERELATIKVLGFYHAEVHSYVNKETWILTVLGILLGMPLGWLLGRYVMGILKLSSLEFYIELYPISYLYAAVITIVFGIVVNSITNKTLDKINMVEALKSVE